MSGTFFTFALSVLPALLGLGVTSYSRLADLAVQDAYYARAIGRIRAFYLTIEPGAAQYWLQPAGDDAHAVMRQAGQRTRGGTTSGTPLRRSPSSLASSVVSSWACSAPWPPP